MEENFEKLDNDSVIEPVNESLYPEDELIEEEKARKALRKIKRRSLFSGMLLGVLLTIFLLLSTVAVLVSIGFLGFRTNKVNNQTADTGTETTAVISESLQDKIKYMLYIMENKSLYDLDYEALTDGLLHGLVMGLDDDYAAYYNLDELARVQESNSGSYYGIGVTVQQDENGIVHIIQVAEESPSEEAGVLVEDIIYKVGDEEVTGMDINELVAMIKGSEGTTVNITFFRPSTSEYLVFDVERRNIKQIISYGEMLDDNIGYIRIKSFDEITYEQLQSAISDLKSQGMKAVVLDLRNNTGGLLTSLVPVANEFLPKGTILTIEDKNGVIEEYTSDDTPFLNLPMVVLVNGYTASAAEALTGAIQDYGVGTIMGTITFGKGIVQNTFPISDGTAIKLTIARYMTPSGRCIQGEGIEPDIVIEPDGSGVDNQLEKAIEVLKDKMAQ